MNTNTHKQVRNCSVFLFSWSEPHKNSLSQYPVSKCCLLMRHHPVLGWSWEENNSLACERRPLRVHRHQLKSGYWEESLGIVTMLRGLSGLCLACGRYTVMVHNHNKRSFKSEVWLVWDVWKQLVSELYTEYQLFACLAHNFTILGHSHHSHNIICSCSKQQTDTVRGYLVNTVEHAETKSLCQALVEIRSDLRKNRFSNYIS